jgi:HAD superfamily hydrolase (TIGR01509 family)
MYDAILFDFDGVLADTEPVHYECWKEALAPIGVTLTWDFYSRNCVGMADSEMVNLIGAACNTPRPGEELWKQYPVKKGLFRARMTGAPPFARGLGELLSEASARCKLAVVTSSARSEVEPVLEAGGLLGYFSGFVCGREAGALKPAPDPYLAAAKLLGAVKPLVVEDSAPGIAAGRAAGFDVLAVPSAEEMPRLVLDRIREAAA